MATNDVAARIAALQNLQPYTGSQITWPKLWGNLPLMGQTPEGYVVARQPGGNIQLADPNNKIGQTNNIMGLSDYLTTGGSTGWIRDFNSPEGNPTGFDPGSSLSKYQALSPYQVGVDGLGQTIYDFGDGKLITAEGNTPFNAKNGGGIAPTAPESARRTDGMAMGGGYDEAKMRELGYEMKYFGGAAGDGSKPYDPFLDSGEGVSQGWVKNVNGTLFDPTGRVINPTNAPTDAANGAWQHVAPEGAAYAGSVPPGADPATWGKKPGFELNLNPASAWQPQQQQAQQAQQAVTVPALFGGSTTQQGGLLGIAQQQAPQQAQQQQTQQQGLSMQSMNPFFSRYWGK